MCRGTVTPLVGVWIEITIKTQLFREDGSLPLWECGLKFSMNINQNVYQSVTPLVGVWIEIGKRTLTIGQNAGHSPCGSVD